MRNKERGVQTNRRAPLLQTSALCHKHSDPSKFFIHISHLIMSNSSETSQAKVAETPQTKEVPADTQAESTKKPLASFKYGLIEATIWPNKITSSNGKVVELPKIALQKSYKKQGNWEKTTVYLDREDLLPAAFALAQAFGHLRK